MENISSKKGQTISSLPMVIMTLTFAAIVLVLGIVVSSSLQNTTNGDETGTVSSNETITLAGTGISSEVVSSAYCGYTSWTPTAVYNCTAPGCVGATNNTLTETTDYTVNANGSLVNVTYLLTPLKVTYTYTWGGEACDAANLTVFGLGTFADFWEIIVLAIVITVVIGMLLIVFGGSRRR